MTSRRAAFALLLASALPGAASDLALFSREGLKGRQLLLRAATPDFDDIGFRERVESLAVRTGRWELCSEPGYKGFCAFFAEGEYRVLNPRFNNRVTSARPATPP